ncbi:X-linked lymphocyte-regulated protein 5C-like isoform X2 [Mesocricetus auratus]|uniref:X-linked lymphocyte-regulated protein 5C-like isoform X2 n=1 Tax=Mesocricetus auratus TaxID=10036 RepID=A0ABM2X221_MESAU|nr:X-linked lymphocyte-regulated protein 5C-like isoform X2 [Mesocricetus auratus]
MSTKEEKDMERSAKRPRVDPNLPSDDSQNPDAIMPAKNPAVDTSEVGSCYSGSDVQEAREPVQKRTQDFKGSIIQSLLAKRKQFEKDINASFRSLNKNLQSIFRTQQKSRQELHSMHSQIFESLYHKWLDEVGRAREQEDHLNRIAQQQMKILQKAIEDHETKIENAKDLCNAFLKKAKDLHEHRKAFVGGERSEVKKEISKAQERVIMETQEQDVSVVETYLQSLVVDCPEETI